MTSASLDPNKGLAWPQVWTHSSIVLSLDRLWKEFLNLFKIFKMETKVLFLSILILISKFDFGQGDCRPFGSVPLTFGTFFPNPTNLPALQGTLTSPNYPSAYNSFQQCTYLIWGPQGSNVTITFQVIFLSYLRRIVSFELCNSIQLCIHS